MGRRPSSHGRPFRHDSITMDQYKQNDDVIFFYNEDHHKPSAGLQFNEQRDARPIDVLERMKASEVARGKNAADRGRITLAFNRAHFRNLQRFAEDFNSEDGSYLTLGDQRGRVHVGGPRFPIVLKADEPECENGGRPLGTSHAVRGFRAIEKGALDARRALHRSSVMSRLSARPPHARTSFARARRQRPSRNARAQRRGR